MTNAAWSQAGQSGGAGTSGAAGAAGATGTAGPGGVAGAAGTAANPGPQQNRLGINAQANARNPTSASVNSNGISQQPFFGDPGVRRQLNLNDSQFNSLNRAYQDAYGRYVRNLGGLPANLTEQQRMAQMQQFQNQFNIDFGRSLDSTFTDPRYRARYDQLKRQYMGFNSFNDPAIQRQLNLTPQQRVQIQRMANDWRNEMRRAQRSGSSLTQQQWEQMWSRNWDQLNGTFTPEQQQTWAQLTGERFPFRYEMFSRQGDERGASGNVDLPERPETTPNPPAVPNGNAPQPNLGTGGGQATPQGTNANAGGSGTTR